MRKLCKACGSQWHYKTFCPYIRKKAIKKIGKQAKLNQEDRMKWLATNPPDAYGEWKCYLNISPHCFRRVDIGTLNIEHVRSKVRRPDLRHDLSNMKPACPACNALKGSKDVENFN